MKLAHRETVSITTVTRSSVPALSGVAVIALVKIVVIALGGTLTLLGWVCTAIGALGGPLQDAGRSVIGEATFGED